MKITLDIPDAVYPRVRDAFAAKYGFDPNGRRDFGLTADQFVAKMLLHHLGSVATDVEADRAAVLARNAVKTNRDDPLVVLHESVKAAPVPGPTGPTGPQGATGLATGPTGVVKAKG